MKSVYNWEFKKDRVGLYYELTLLHPLNTPFLRTLRRESAAHYVDRISALFVAPHKA